MKLCDQPATDDAFSPLQRLWALACATRGGGVAFRGCEQAGSKLEPIEDGFQPGNVPFRRYARGASRPHPHLNSNSIHPSTACPPPPANSCVTSCSLAFGCRFHHAQPRFNDGRHAENTSPDFKLHPNSNPLRWQFHRPTQPAFQKPRASSPSPLAASGDSTSRSRWIRDRKGRNQAAEVAGAQNRNQSQVPRPGRTEPEPALCNRTSWMLPKCSSSRCGWARPYSWQSG